MIFTHDKNTGEVISYSEGLNQVSDKFEQLEFQVTDEEYEKLQQNYKPWIRNNILVLEKPQRIIDEEEKQKKENDKMELKEKLKDPKVQLKDIADLLLELLN